jgi:hypothetical protein
MFDTPVPGGHPTVGAPAVSWSAAKAAERRRGGGGTEFVGAAVVCEAEKRGLRFPAGFAAARGGPITLSW